MASSTSNRIEPTVRLETSSGTSRFITGSTRQDTYPLAPIMGVSTFQNRDSPDYNEKEQFRKRLVAHYPAKYVLFVSLAILLLNFVILYCEVSLNQLRYYQYNVYFVSKYAVITSLTNNLYALLALITIKFRNYFFIQMVTILHLVGFFATGFFSVFLNIFSFILVVMEKSCQGHCILVETMTISAALMSGVFSMAFFMKLQFNFLRKLNMNSFASSDLQS